MENNIHTKVIKGCEINIEQAKAIVGIVYIGKLLQCRYEPEFLQSIDKVADAISKATKAIFSESWADTLKKEISTEDKFFIAFLENFIPPNSHWILLINEKEKTMIRFEGMSVKYMSNGGVTEIPVSNN